MKKYLSVLFLAITATGLTSCLKDKNVNLPPGGSPPVIEISTNTFAAPTSDLNSPVAVYTQSYELVPSATIVVNIGYTGGQPAPQDITVNLDSDPTKIEAYNDYTESDFTALPATLFTMPSSVVIKKGQNLAQLTVTLKPNQFDLSQAYILPIHIASVSSGTISGNYGTILVVVGAKNKYDGRYTVTGTLVDATLPGATAKSPTGFDLYTMTANSVAMFDYGYSGTFGHRFLNGGGDSYYGTWAPVFTFDDAGNITSVVNYYGQPAANGRSAKLDPTGINKFTSGTPGTAGATFKVKYFMLQPGSTVRTTCDETWVLQGPRP
ncbi:DUF1735 domain-containing protein [Mucilaginibacter sp.]|jgi:hypothetical protein|uniref:DUF1735 domain-containing protein n=1 Tax=Mucilaginibacter sp. TaxID=1882438 RepID=UPI0035650B78